MIRVRSLLAAAALGAAPPAWPQPGLVGDGPSPVRVSVVPDLPRVGSGQTLQLAVVFDIQPGWHISWRNPGAGSVPPRVIVSAPPGYDVGRTLWTRPRAFTSEIGREFGYEGQAVLFVPVKAPATLGEGRLALEIDLHWTVCRKDVCLIGSASRAVELETTSRPVPAGRVPALLRKHRNRLPKPLSQLRGASVEYAGGTLRVTGPTAGHSSVTFFPIDSPGVMFDEPQVVVKGDRFEITADVEADARNARGEPMVVGGLVALGEKPDDPCYDFQLSLSGGSR